MTWNDNLRRLAEAFGSVGVKVYHYHRPLGLFPAIVWAEESANSLHADNGMGEQSPRGTLDYFTQSEFDPTVDTIQAKLQELGLAWELLSVQFEEDTGVIHYEWSWEV